MGFNPAIRKKGKIMFTSIRFSFKLKEGARILTMTVKEWKTKEQAMKYLIRYAGIPWFAGGAIEDEFGDVLYERTPTQTEHFYAPSRLHVPALAKDSVPVIGGIFHPFLTNHFAPPMAEPIGGAGFS